MEPKDRGRGRRRVRRAKFNFASSVWATIEGHTRYCNGEKLAYVLGRDLAGRPGAAEGSPAHKGRVKRGGSFSTAPTTSRDCALTVVCPPAFPIRFFLRSSSLFISSSHF